VEKVGQFDMVFCGRQAIDGDTAQVGPQVAEKLGLPQITYTEAIQDLDVEGLVARRAFEGGTEIVRCQLPCLLTVVSSANQPRPSSVRRRILYKMAAIPQEYRDLLKSYPEFEDEEALQRYLEEKNLAITVWSAADLDVDEALLGLSGSPTQVYKVNYVVLESTDSKEINPSLEGIKAMIEELVQEYIVG
jgi:electron transfer flavoprotein beta subunit